MPVSAPGHAPRMPQWLYLAAIVRGRRRDWTLVLRLLPASGSQAWSENSDWSVPCRNPATPAHLLAGMVDLPSEETAVRPNRRGRRPSVPAWQRDQWPGGCVSTVDFDCESLGEPPFETQPLALAVSRSARDGASDLLRGQGRVADSAVHERQRLDSCGDFSRQF